MRRGHEKQRGVISTIRPLVYNKPALLRHPVFVYRLEIGRKSR